MENPFSLEPYTTKEHFCNREQELKALIEKELLLDQSDLNGKSYSVYNVFLSRWMETL